MSKIPAPAQSPVWWLPELVEQLGPPQTSPELARWTWRNDSMGVFIDQLSNAWQTAVWAPRRSVTLRTVKRPSDADVLRLVSLAGLLDAPGRVR